MGVYFKTSLRNGGWRGLCACVGNMLAWVAWVTRLHGWRVYVAGVLAFGVDGVESVLTRVANDSYDSN